MERKTLREAANLQGLIDDVENTIKFFKNGKTIKKVVVYFEDPKNAGKPDYAIVPPYIGDEFIKPMREKYEERLTELEEQLNKL